MSVKKVDVTLINNIVRTVAKQGGDLNKIDTDEERSLFADQLEKNGYKPKNFNGSATDLVNLYTTEPDKMLAQFKNNGLNDDNKEKFAIFKALNPEIKNIDGQVNKYTPKEIDQIVDDINDAVTGWWFFLGGGTKDNKLARTVKQISKDNVLEVMDKYKSKHGESLAYAIDDDTSDEDQDKLGTSIINALVEKADEVGVDITSIITKQNKSTEEGNTEEDKTNTEYVVVNVAGVKAGESATADDVFEKVVDALENKIKTGLAIQAGDEKAIKENKQVALLTFAKQADDNGNGVLEDDEVAKFKELCAGIGVYVNDILSSMEGKSDSSYTEDEKTIKNIFAESGYGAAYAQQEAVDMAGNTINTAISQKDYDTLDEIISSDNINADNVEDVLSKIDKEETEYQTYTGSAGVANTISYKTSNLKRLVERDEKYAEVIIKALVEKAEANGVDVSDIVKSSNGSYYTASEFLKTGEDATQKEYAYEVISKLREKIKEEANQEEYQLI